MSESNKVLVVDAGNTSIKWATFIGNDVIEIERSSPSSQANAISLESHGLLNFKPDYIYLASVRSSQDNDSIKRYLASQYPEVTCLALKSQTSSCGIQNAYLDVSRLGVDRWLTVIAAFDAKRDTVVVDAGTALKIEFMPANGQYQGGYIVPGQTMMEQMLVANTGKIRFNEKDLENYQGVINNTGLAVHLGCWEMTLALVQRVYQQQSHCRFVFTGGDGEKIMKALNIAADYEPNLVLKGAKMLGDEWVKQK